MSRKLWSFALIIGIVVRAEENIAENNEHCTVDNDCSSNEAYLSLIEDIISDHAHPDLNSPSSDYLKLIKDQWTFYPMDTVISNDRSCRTPFDSVITDDLLVWRGGISREEFEQAKPLGVHYQIIDHKLYREPDCMFTARCEGIQHFLLKIIDHLPNTELVINVFDWPKSMKTSSPKPVFSFSKTTDYFDIMYPAWSFWSGGPAIATEPTGLGRWDLKRTALANASFEWSWERKRAKGFFRGSRTSSERDPLILLSREKSELVDAAYTRNQAWKSMKDSLNAEPAAIVDLEEHCKYKYLFNFRGVAASFRYRHLFLCGSLVFQIDSEWKEFFYDSLKPWLHYLPVYSNCTNIEHLIEFAQNNEKIAKMIANRGFKFIWDHLTPENVQCYWRKLVQEYAKLVKWTPKRDLKFIGFS